MRTAAGLHAGLGLIWIPIVGPLVTSPLGILQSSYQFGVVDTFLAIAICFQAMFGFYIWFGNLSFAFSGDYLAGSGLSFWGRSLCHHLIWIPLIPMLLGTSFLGWWSGSLQFFPFVWITSNIVTAIVGLTVTPSIAEARDNKAMDTKPRRGQN